MVSTNIRMIAGCAAVAVSCLSVQAKVEPYGILPTAAHLPYQEREIMAIVHYGYAFYTSDDGKSWTLRAEGEFGNVLANPVRQRVTLAQPVKARYFKFVGTHAANDCNHVAVAEFYLF